MVLNLEHHVPSIGISVPGQKRSLRISGTVDYTALTTDPPKHGASCLSVYLIALKLSVESFIRNSLFQFVKRQNPNGLFVTEAKQEGVPLAQHVAQAVAEMYASAKYLMYAYDSACFLATLLANVESHSTRKGILRGALTNGHEWIFLILYLNEDGDGGMYAESPTIKIQVSDSYPYHVLSPGPDIVAGILAYWVCCTLFSSLCPYERMLVGTQLCWS